MPPYQPPYPHSGANWDYTWGHPELYLTQPELIRVTRVKDKVKATLDNWKNVPTILRPIAEDITSNVPGWLIPRPKVERSKLFDEDDD